MFICRSPDRLSWWSALVIGWWLFWQRRPVSADQSEKRRWLMNARLLWPQSVIFHLRLSFVFFVIIIKAVIEGLCLHSTAVVFLWWKSLPVACNHVLGSRSNTHKHANYAIVAQECGLISGLHKQGGKKLICRAIVCFFWLMSLRQI